MNKYKVLIDNIEKSDLSEKDKQKLIEILSRPKVDLDFFLKTFLTICKLKSVIAKLFDIDIGD